jgi:hypothetical protein
MLSGDQERGREEGRGEVLKYGESVSTVNKEAEEATAGKQHTLFSE